MGDITTKEDDSKIRLFETLDAIGRGSLVYETADKLQEIVQSAQKTNKKATLTLTITVDPDPKSDAFRVTGEVKVKLAKDMPKAALFFPTPDGKLTRSDPRQRTMFGEAV